MADFDFDTVRSAARTAWEQALSAIVVEGGNADDRKIFYTALYHSMVVPNVVSDVNGEYRRHDMTTGRMPRAGSITPLSPCGTLSVLGIR